MEFLVRNLRNFHKTLIDSERLGYLREVLHNRVITSATSKKCLEVLRIVGWIHPPAL